MLAKKELTSNVEFEGNHYLNSNQINDIQSKDAPFKQDDDLPDVYGELVVLGFNGVKPQHWLIHPSNTARRDLCTKYRLRRRMKPNGVVSSNILYGLVPNSADEDYSVANLITPDMSEIEKNNALLLAKQIRAAKTHSISYKKSKTEVFVEDYLQDVHTDMFQVGRSTEKPIDFTVRDYWPQKKVLNKNDAGDASCDLNLTATESMQQGRNEVEKSANSCTESTISRFACRIIVNRSKPFQPRLFAAGFDVDNHIFLGEKAIKWTENKGKIMDALTTNGVLSMRPIGELWEPTVQPGAWREISVRGSVSQIRSARSAKDRGAPKKNENNVLTDGTLIDLCGVCILFRSPEGLSRSPKLCDLEQRLEALNAGRPQCPVGLNTLVIPRNKTSSQRTERDPYAYLQCGHVQGRHPWGKQPNHSRTCPMCLRVGKVARVCMGMEPAFYVGSSCEPTHAFVPCGHIASKETCEYWAKLSIPQEKSSFRPNNSICPFCGTSLDKQQPFVKLTFCTEYEM